VRLTRVVFADQLKPGDIIVTIDGRHGGTRERVVIAIRNSGGLVTGIADDNGEQVELGYGAHATVRILLAAR
jgi:hypothetical protein